MVCLNRLLVSQFAALEVIVQDRFSSAAFPVTWVALLVFSTVICCLSLQILCNARSHMCFKSPGMREGRDTHKPGLCVRFPPSQEECSIVSAMPSGAIAVRGKKKSSLPWKEKYD